MSESIGFHGTDRVILLLHSDCGAYVGLPRIFNSDEAIELDHHGSELRQAHAVLKRTFPAVAVECYFIDFAGVWQLDSFTAPEAIFAEAGAW